jgi:hypothetical protein
MTAAKRTKKPSYKKPESVKELERLANEKELSRYPNFPYPVKASYRDDTANGLTKCVIAWLKLHGCQAERINTTGRMIDERYNVKDVTGKTRQIGSVRWIYSTTTNGSADISATIDGRSVKIEIKIGRDVQSDAQRRYQKEVETAGGVYLIVHNFTEFLDWWNDYKKGGQND